MTTLAEIDVVINARLEPLISAGKKAEAIINNLDKSLNKLSKKNYSPKLTVNTDTKKVDNLNKILNKLSKTNYTSKVDIKTNTSKLDSLIKKLNSLKDKKINVTTRASTNKSSGSSSIGSADVSLPSVKGIKTTVAAVGAALGTNEIIQYADAWTLAGNKIAAASEGAGVQSRSLEELNDLANKSRAGFAETVDLYAKLTRAASGVAKSESEIALATETVTKAMKAGGASATEQKSAILQLGQALGSGVLQGDELRSIRENSPVLAKAIAKEFNTTVAGLKQLGAEGKLVSDRVFKAIISAAGDIDKQFKATTPTIQDSFTLLSNSVTEFIGKFAEAQGVGKAVYAITNALIDNFQSVATAAAAAAVVLLSPSLASSVANLASKSLLLLNPWVAMAAAIGVAAYAISEFWDDIVPLEGSFAKLGDYATVAWNAIKDGAMAAKDIVVQLFDALTKGLGEVITFVKPAFEEVFNFFKSYYNNVIQIFVNMKDTLILVFGQIPAAIADGVISAMNFMIESVKKALDTVVDGINKAIGGINSLLAYAGKKGFGTVDPIKITPIGNPYKDAASKFSEEMQKIWKRETNDFIGNAGEAVLDVAGKAGIAIAGAVGNATDTIVGKANEVAEARKELERETNRANARITKKDPNAGFGTGSKTPPSTARRGGGGGGSARKKESKYEKEFNDVKARTDALIAQTKAQAELNPLINDYEYATTRSKTAQELLSAAQRSGVAAGKELKDVQQLLNGDFSNLTPTAREQAQAMLDLANKYADAKVAAEKLSESQNSTKKAMDDVKSLGKSVLGGFISDLREGKSAAESLESALDKIADKLIDMAIDDIFSGGGFGSGLRGLFSGGGGGIGGLFSSLLSGFADGGRIRGPGTGRSDSIPIMASNGEFMVNAESAAKYLPLLEAINDNRPIGMFANGGMIRVPNHSIGSKGSSGSMSPVEINIINNSQAQVSQSERQTSGGLALDVVIDDVVSKNLSKPGTNSRSAVQSQFGLSNQLARR